MGVAAVGDDWAWLDQIDYNPPDVRYQISDDHPILVGNLFTFGDGCAVFHINANENYVILRLNALLTA